MVALLRAGKRPWNVYADLLEDEGSALPILQDELGLLAAEQIDEAVRQIAQWEARSVQLTTILDPEYPQNLRAVHDRPPMIFVAGSLAPEDGRAVAVIGSRRPSKSGIAQARQIGAHLAAHGYTVASGLATGIDTAAHTGALEREGRTIAVIGTGLDHCYPPQNAALQRRIAKEGAVVSQFWPETRPSRRTFPMRNAVMSGISLATVVVEASATSGARLQTRLARGQGRAVLLLGSLVQRQPWARELARRPGTHVVNSPDELTAVVDRLTSPGALVA